MSKQKFGEFSENRLLLDQIADKWTILVLLAISQKPIKFNEVRLQAAGINHDALTLCLRKLERNGLITKEILKTEPVSSEYSVTALGLSLAELFQTLDLWTQAKLEEVTRAQNRFDDFQGQRRAK